MSENVLETVRATVQDFLAPELRTHGVRLESLDKRVDEVNKNLEHRIEDWKETLRAEMRALDARMSTLESLIRGLAQQISVESTLRERVASQQGFILAHRELDSVWEATCLNISKGCLASFFAARYAFSWVRRARR